MFEMVVFVMVRIGVGWLVGLLVVVLFVVVMLMMDSFLLMIFLVFVWDIY